jgi:hypothetical protein
VPAAKARIAMASEQFLRVPPRTLQSLRMLMT